MEENTRATAPTNGPVFVIFAVMYGLMRSGIVRFGYRGQ
jgi:hypothetical protein